MISSTPPTRPHPAPRPPPPPAFDDVSSLHSTAPIRALLVGSAWDGDLRRSGLELVKRLNKRARTSRNRQSKQAPEPYKLGTLDRFPSRIGPHGVEPVELHILVTETSKKQLSEEEQQEASYAKRVICNALRQEGAKVVVHSRPFESRRLSLVSSSNVGAAFLRALDTPALSKVLCDGINAAGFVFTCEDVEEGQDERLQPFLKSIARSFESSKHKSPPSVTLYLPARPTRGDFDLDMDAGDVRAVQIAQNAADVLTTSASRSQGPSSTLALPSSLDTRRRSFELPHPFTTSAPTETDNRRHSFLPQSSAPLASSSDSSHSIRPLLLRPAPGPGAQSISMRLALNTKSQDVVLRVTEAQTPISPIRTAFSRRQPVEAAPPLPTASIAARSPSPPSAAVPIFSRTTRPPSPKLHINIPTSPQPTQTPKLVSSFSPDSDEGEGDSGPTTPPVDSPYHPSPIEKIPLHPSTKEAAEETPLSAVGEGWSEVRGLLQSRVEKAEQLARRSSLRKV